MSSISSESKKETWSDGHKAEINADQATSLNRRESIEPRSPTFLSSMPRYVYY